MTRSIIKKKVCSNKAVKRVIPDPLLAGCEDGTLLFLRTGESANLPSGISSLACCDGCLAVGLFSGQILRSVASNYSGFEPLYSHSQNACAIDTISGRKILSGSWDNRVHLHDISSGMTHTFSHPSAVWAVKFLGPTSFVTGCADGRIRIFSKNTIVREIAYHTGPVRSLLAEGAENSADISRIVFYSADNHGTVLKTTGRGDLLAARRLGEMFFTICRWQERIVVSGYPGTLFVLNRDLQVLRRIELNIRNIWSLAVTGEGALLVAGSDGAVYSLDKYVDGGTYELEDDGEQKRMMTSEQAKEDEKQKEDETQKEPSTDGAEKVFVSGGFRYMVKNEKVYLERNGEWELIGDEAAQWDHTFKVTLGSREYTLNFNKTEATHDVARRFIGENKLSPAYYQEVVDFINENFRRSSQYVVYDGIQKEKIESLIGQHQILPLIAEVEQGKEFSTEIGAERNVYQLEQALFDSEDGKKLPLLVILDICRYLVAKRLPLDLSFLTRTSPKTAKEAKAFVFLLTNLVENPPFSIECLDQRVRDLKDQGLLTESDLHKYQQNMSVRRKSKMQ